jgi:hypothetical protein
MNKEMLKLAFLAAKLPIIGLLILELLWYGFEQVSALSFLAGDYLYIVKFGLFFWAGYKATQVSNFKLTVALIAGALSAIAVGIIDFILSAIFYPGSMGGFGYWFWDCIKWAIYGAITAGVGHYVASYRRGDSGHSNHDQQPDHYQQPEDDTP